MGEVFRARDTRLNRTVAIKVLVQDRAQDPGMRMRFEHEARAIAALNHPHICHLNDIGHQDGVDFLVMEHLEGETLAHRLLRSKALPLEDVVRHAIEIAEALSEAHRHGIVHRDLKPGNVFLVQSSGSASPPSVKLLDFGLAKLHETPGALSNSWSTAGARDQPLTEEGAILGTWRYMAPEQLEGKEIDVRTDIFAFGVVLYEMTTGKKPFDGDNHASVIAAILDTEPPPISALQPMAPPALVRIVSKCLAKNPDARWQTARDLADALKWIGDEPSASLVSAAPSRGLSKSTIWRWVAPVVAASVAALAIVVSLPRRDTTAQPTRRFSIVPPADAALFESQLAISPNGRYVVYRGRAPQGVQLYLRALDQLEARALPGTTGGLAPVFSPDNQWLAFIADQKLKKASLTSGAAPITLGDFPNRSPGMTWLPNNDIIAGQISVGLFRVSGQGGPLIPLTTADVKRREIDHHNPSSLPGGKALLITVHRGAEAFDVAVQQLGSEERRILVQDAFDARYVPSGHLIFARGNTLFAATFDPDRREVTGPEIAVVENVATALGDGVARYGVSDDGCLVYIPAVSRQGRRLAWVDRRGAIEPLPIGPDAYVTPSLSPDGRRLAVQVGEAKRDIWVYDFDSDALTRVTFDGASEAPVWTPDGRRLTFSSTKEGRRQIYWQPIDSPGKAELLVADEHSVWAGSWSPDSGTLAYTREPPTGQLDIGLFRLNDRRPTPVLASEAVESWARISPDGRWLAYTSFEPEDQVYVMDLSNAGIKRQVSTDGGNQAVWSRDGRELFYRSRRGFMVVSVTSLPTGIGKPSELPIRGRLAGGSVGHPGYDVSPDGRRLLVVEQAGEEAAPRQIQVVLNWFTELQARVPSK
jgi:serine/threonine-protein kinase